MPDSLDKILWTLEQHRRAVLGVVLALVVAAVAVLIFRGGGDDPPSIPQGAVAVVGTQPITRTTFDHWTGVYRRSGVGGTNPTATQTDHAVLQILVAASWTAQEAARLGVTVKDSEVNQAVQATFTQAKAQGVSRAKVLQQVGGSESDLAWEERASLLGRAIEQRAGLRAPKATAAQIAAQYAKDGARWSHPSTRSVQVLLTDDRPTALKALAALRGSASFAQVAQQYGSKQVTSAVTNLNAIKPGTRDPGFERAVFAAPVGQVSGPAQVSTGWIVFKVASSTPLPAIPLATASKTIASELNSAAQSKAIADYLAAFRKSWKAKTRCLPSVRDSTICGA